MTTHDDLNTPMIATVGLLGAILVFAIVVLLMVVFYRFEARQQAEMNRQPPAEVSNLVAEQQAELARYRWVNEQQKIVGIPISRAMDLVVGELSREAESVENNSPQSDRKGDEDG